MKSHSLVGVILVGFALGIASAAEGEREGEGKGKTRPKTLSGVIGKIDGDKLTVRQRGDSGEKTTDVTLTAETKIRLETEMDEDIKVKGEGGVERTVTQPKTAEGKRADLKVDQRVVVTHGEDLKATDVLVKRPPKVRKEGDR